MNKSKIISVAILLVAGITMSAEQSKKHSPKQSCWQTAQTQLELNECAGAGAHNADAELNRIYSAMLHKLSNDTVALESLKESERQWLKYRDAQMKALHPHPEDEGSVHPMCVSSEERDLTTERIKTLQAMLNPNEGDACAY